MNKFLTSFVLVLAAAIGGSAYAAPAGLPGSANYGFSVVNISQGNKDATVAPARPGDTLRYEISLSSDAEDVVDFVASVDVSGILMAADMIDAGLGTISGGKLTFPPFSQKAPCGKKYTFFVRVKQDCGGKSSIGSRSNDYASTTVGLACTEAPAPTAEPAPTPGAPARNLPQVGPKSGMIIGFIIFLTVLLGIQMIARRES